MQPLPSPPSPESRLEQQNHKMKTLTDVRDMPDKTPDDLGRQLARLAVAGVRVPEGLWREGMFAQRMFVQGVLEGGRFINWHFRASGVA